MHWNAEGVEVSCCADAVTGGGTVGHRAEQLVTPASVMKIQIVLAVASGLDSGTLGGAATIRLDDGSRTPGPVGMSLMTDPV